MDNIFCQYCGTPNNADAKFCKGCGRQFTYEPQQPAAPQNPQQPVYPQQPIAPQYPQQPITPQYPQQPVYPQPQGFQPQGGGPQQPVVPQYSQQPNIPLQPAYTPAPPKKKKWIILLIGILLAIVGCIVVINGYDKLFMKPMHYLANDFLAAMQSQNYATAYSLMSTDVQTQLGSAEGLKAFMESNGLVFKAYSLTTLNRIPGDPAQGIQLADLTLLDGSTYKIEVDMQVGPDSYWQVIGFGPAEE